eukprot:TRINITY_DN6328_c0_g1_i1.p1 TRINITY_DN6328_c0_g1~~TRINITY_DN6328_c0_g1_i1.p1  ORF type:complete len:623 (-),score=183.87 TRINITY_DN6328_c0_g1_i1:129-1997(-)
MSIQLTNGALAQICQGEEVTEPLLQVLGHKAIQGGGQERFRLLLSDGQFTNSFSMLATQFNNLVHEKKLEMFTVIRVKKQLCNQVPGQSKRVVIILDLEVVAPGNQVNKKIGNPVQIGADGKIPNPVDSENANPNSGGGAVKRPSTTPITDVSTPKAKVVYKPPTRLSIGSSGVVATPIASITPYQNKWTIKARVTSKGDMRTWNKPSGSGKLFAMDLMDESGEIRVTAFKDQADAFYDLAVVGKVYYISNCSVKAANKQYSKLKNDYELTFKDSGTMELVEDDTSDVPTMTYNFARIADLAVAEKDTNIDVIGVCKSHNELTTLISKAGKELVKREITLVDRSETEVSLTLWGNTATNFSAVGNPIVAAKGAKVSDFNGVTLSGGDILINPDMDLAHELKGWWDNEGCSAKTNSITIQGQRGGQDRVTTTKMLGEVKQENLGSGNDRGEYYSTTATITFFSKDKALYKACGEEIDGKVCNKKVVESGDGTYRCEKCARDKTTFKWRIMLQINMADATDNTWASCFQETAEKILGVKSDELGYWLETDEEKYNAVFQEATFKTYSFRMRVKEDNYNDESKLKHTVVQVDDLHWKDHCKKLIGEIEGLGGALPESIEKTKYVN